MSNSYELQVHRAQENMSALGLQQNSIGTFTGSNMGSTIPYQHYPCTTPNCGCGILGCQCHYHYHSAADRGIRDFEVLIEASGKDTVTLNYGAKLRLVMADPIKGHDLRMALAALQAALKELAG